MNLERIAEIEASFSEDTLMAVIDYADVAELCRLARLGLRVEGAPVVDVYGDHHCAFIDHTFSDEGSPHYIGKRVALVVTDA